MMWESTWNTLSVGSGSDTPVSTNVLKLKICKNKRKHKGEAFQFVKKARTVQSAYLENGSISKNILTKARISGSDTKRVREKDNTVDAYSTEPQLHAVRKSQRLQNENVKSIFKKIKSEENKILYNAREKIPVSVKRTDFDVIKPVAVKSKPNYNQVTKKPEIDYEKIPVSTKSSQDSEKILTNTAKSKPNYQNISASKKPKTDCGKPNIHREKIPFTTDSKRRCEKVLATIKEKNTRISGAMRSNEPAATINESPKLQTKSFHSGLSTELKEQKLATNIFPLKPVLAPKLKSFSILKNKVNGKSKLPISLAKTPNSTRENLNINPENTSNAFNLTQNAYKLAQNLGKKNILNYLLSSPNGDKPAGASSGLTIIGGKSLGTSSSELTIIEKKPAEDNNIIFLNDVRPTKVISELTSIANKHTTLNAIKPSPNVSKPIITDSSKVTFNVTKATTITSNHTPYLGKSITVTSNVTSNGAISKATTQTSNPTPNFGEPITVNCNFTTNDGKPTIITSDFPLNFCKLTPNLGKTAEDNATPKIGKSTTITPILTTNVSKPTTLNAGNLVSISQVDLSTPQVDCAETNRLNGNVQSPLTGASFPKSLSIQEASPSNKRYYESQTDRDSLINNYFHQQSTFANLFSEDLRSTMSSHDDFLVLGRNCIVKLEGNINQPTPLKLFPVLSSRDQSCDNEIITGDICPDESPDKISDIDGAINIKIEPGLINDYQNTDKSFPANESWTLGANDCSFRIKTEPGIDIEPSSTNTELTVTQNQNDAIFIKTECESNDNQISVSIVKSEESLAENEDNAYLFHDSNSFSEPNVSQSLWPGARIESEPSVTLPTKFAPRNYNRKLNLIKIQPKAIDNKREELIESFVVSKKNTIVEIMRSSSNLKPAIDGATEIITKPVVPSKKIRPKTVAPNQAVTLVPSVSRTFDTHHGPISETGLSYLSQALVELNDEADTSLQNQTMPVLEMNSGTTPMTLTEIIRENQYDLWDPPRYAPPPNLSREDNVWLQPGIPDNLAKPLRLGFVREIRLRRIITSKQKMDVYYFAPVAYRKDGRSKFRSSVEIKDHLDKLNIPQLSGSDFSFRGIIISAPPWEFVMLAGETSGRQKLLCHK